jgi:acetoin utilization deacetylase AcuC-like enzyme
MDIKIVYSNNHLKHAPEFEFFEGEKLLHAEVPARVESIIAKLREKNIGAILNPHIFSEDFIYKLHSKYYIDFIKTKSAVQKPTTAFYPSYYIMDTYTPIVAGTFEAAKTAVDTALTGAELVKNGEKLVYSLCRPPGHHAEHTVMGGYCYFNNAAIAAEYLSKNKKVAIIDIDFHHGNGTQQLFYNRNDVFYVSLHADPSVKFPYETGFSNEVGVGDGKGYNKNYPLPLGITNEKYLHTLQKALQVVHAFNPDYVVVSAGFDTYEKDPIGGFLLTIPFYKTIGEQIALLKKPILVIQEGGYAVDALGNMAYHLLVGLDS